MIDVILEHFCLDQNYREIHEGYSHDKKYIAYKDSKKFLLRQIDATKRSETNVQIDVANQCSLYGLPVQKLVDIHLGLEYDYLLYEWIDGQNLYDALVNLDEETQYQLGVRAGKIHKAIHNIPCDLELDWVTFFNQKIDRKLNTYRESPLSYQNDHVLITAIDKNRKFLTNKRISYLHGDFHAFNMVLDKNQTLGVIDLNRAEYGDPYEEFLRITWDVERCTPFAKGRIDGYFDNKVPDDFWILLKLYICSDLLTLLYWSHSISKTQVKIALNKYNKVLDDYENFKLDIPKWYK